MNVKDLLKLIETRQFDPLQSAWMRAMEQDMPLADMAGALEALVKAGQTELAETMATLLLEERLEAQGAAEGLTAAKALALAVPESDQLRSEAARLFTEVHGQHPLFEMIMTAAGLTGTQSTRRAVRTLEICLALEEGTYVVNRFDGLVLRLEKYNDVYGEYELTDPRGKALRMEPRNLADEFEPVEADDFRVLVQHRPERLKELIEADPAGLLIGVCMSTGGSVDANQLKALLVPTVLEAPKWSSWWNKARTAAKRSEHLTLDGRPIVVTYHPGGRSLEEEFAQAAAAARMPLEHLAVLQGYVREARARKVATEPAFTDPILATLADQAREYAQRRAQDALAASLGLDAAAELGLPVPEAARPSPAEILASAANPALAIADLSDPALWAPALDALRQRPDAVDALVQLLALAPESHLDEVSAALRAQGADEPIAAAAAAALTEPLAHIELLAWLWNGPKVAVPNVPGRSELLTKMLTALGDVEKDWKASNEERKEVRQRIRNALSVSNYAAYRDALTSTSQAIAATIKRHVERSEGLGQAVQDDMLNLIRETHYGLFVKAKIEPWKDEKFLWTTDAALRRREDELKYLVDVKMLENAHAIGAAAEHGDLSENSEWQFAIQERDLLRAQAAVMQDELARARILGPEHVPTQYVGVGSRVKLQNVNNGQSVEMSFLGPWDSRIEQHVYSYQTPLAQSLMGKRVGETITLKIGDHDGEYRIEAITSALEEA